MNKSELVEKLLRADQDAYFANPSPGRARSSVVIVGGGALLLCDLSSKDATHDVDVLQMAADDAARRALLADPDFNCAVNAYCENIPYNFEDRLRRVELDTLAIDYYVPSPEDLAVMKLYRMSPVDEADLTSPEYLEAIDWDLLDGLVFGPDEAEASRIKEPCRDGDLRAMRRAYAEFRERWRA